MGKLQTSSTKTDRASWCTSFAQKRSHETASVEHKRTYRHASTKVKRWHSKYSRCEPFFYPFLFFCLLSHSQPFIFWACRTHRKLRRGREEKKNCWLNWFKKKTKLEPKEFILFCRRLTASRGKVWTHLSAFHHLIWDDAIKIYYPRQKKCSYAVCTM